MSGKQSPPDQLPVGPFDWSVEETRRILVRAERAKREGLSDLDDHDLCAVDTTGYAATVIALALVASLSPADVVREGWCSMIDTGQPDV